MLALIWASAVEDTGGNFWGEPFLTRAVALVLVWPAMVLLASIPAAVAFAVARREGQIFAFLVGYWATALIAALIVSCSILVLQNAVGVALIIATGSLMAGSSVFVWWGTSPGPVALRRPRFVRLVGLWALAVAWIAGLVVALIIQDSS